jgi:uncharacterized repeat protein (TIGR01451 family)
MQKFMFKILSLFLLLSFLVLPVEAQTPESDPRLETLGTPELLSVENLEKSEEPKTGRYIVLLEDDPLATYQGDVPGLPATSPAVTDRDFDIRTDASREYLNYLGEQQEKLIATAETAINRKIDVDFSYEVALNGFAAKMSAQEAQRIAKLDGVRGVFADELWQPDTDVSPGFIGADTLWQDSESTPGTLATKGEGMIVGIIDTGINMDHPSFADIGGDGYDHENPYGSENYVGLCDTDPTNYICNDKLIGVYGYTSGDETISGEDAEAHGSHTASTAAGNYLELEYNNIPVTISGMAPHANVIAYDVCYDDGCPNSYSTAAVEQAIIDGVDVLNYSIGPSSGAVNPYDNPVELAMLNATAAGVLTSTSAGNAGPAPSTVYKAPAWNLIVANSTHGRIFGYPVEVHETVGTSLYEAVALPGVGVPFTTDFTDYPLRWAGDDGNTEGCAAFSTDFFTGAVALISRGTCGFVDKINNAAAVGAEAVIVYNNSGGPPIVMGGIEGTTIPSAMIDTQDGQAIVALMTTTLKTTISSDQVAGVKDIWADILNSGSSRGPYELLDILVPEVSAPGTNVLAAYNSPGESAPFGGISMDAEIDLMSGTSMASPHGAGSALLLMDLFPDWTPMEVKSAIVMSAYDETTVKEDGLTPTDPFDDGNGRIDLTKAALIGLVMDETAANFADANPAEGGDEKTLNIPSYQNSQCVGECSFSRSVKNVADVATDYNVVIDAPAGVVITATPSSFTIGVGETQTITFDVDVMTAEMGLWQFASVTFDTTNTFTTGEPITNARFQLAVMPDAGNLPALVEKEVFRDAGGVILEDLYSIEIKNLSTQIAALTEADLYEFSLPGDPTNSDPYDSLDGVWWMQFAVPKHTKRLVMEILETTAGDLDLFWGYSLNPGDLPSAATELGSSATGSALEYLSYIDPDEYSYYWVLVQNWGGDSTPDDVALAIGMVPSPPRPMNFSVDGPKSVPALTPFDLEITWDIPEMEPLSAWYGWFSVGTSPSSPGDIGQTELNVYRPYDDVTKTVARDTTETGEVQTYTITVAPNYSGEDLNYIIHDVLPSGVAYIPDSLETSGSTTMAIYDAIANAIHWEGTMPKVEFGYIASDNGTNPYCGLPLGDGSYVDVYSNYGYTTDPGISGDEIYWGYGSQAGTEYYGEVIPGVPIFTDDGYIGMHQDIFQLWDYTNRAFPDPTPPNAILAPWMRDMVVLYDETLNQGITAVNFGVAWLVEFDDVTDYFSLAYPSDVPYNSMDFEVFAWKELDPTVGYPDIVVAFDNVAGDWDWNAGPWGSVGLENEDGTVGTTYAYDDWTPTSGDIVCFDYTVVGADPVEITFDVLVESVDETVITNTVSHEADGFGMREELASVSFQNYPQRQPVALPQTLTTDEDTPLDITLTGMYLQPGPVSWEVLTEPLYGELTGVAPDLLYTPDADFNGEDSFTFMVNDGIMDSEPATITINVLPVNDAPVAVADTYDTDEDTLLDVTAPGVLGNDTDVEDNPLTAVLDTDVEHGTLTLNADGSFSYMPDADFNGEDSFTYKANDGELDSEVVTVTITVTPVNDAPVAVDDSYMTAQDMVLDVLAVGGVLANDSDLEDDPLTAVLVTDVQFGTLVLDPDGSFVYTPNTGFNGVDTFTYRANDGELDSELATVTITVQPPDTYHIYLPIIFR